MFAALSKTLAQFPDPAFRKVVVVSLLASVGAYVVLLIALWLGLKYTSFLDAMPGWETLIDVLGGGVAFLLSLIFFPAVVATVSSLFVDRIAQAVEDKHYPDLGPARQQPLAEIVWQSVKFLLVLIGLNLLALPVYVLLSVFFGLGIVVYYALNGYLLAREYHEMVAARRLDPAGVEAAFKANRTSLWLTGAATTFLLTIPIVNMFGPIIATAVMVHQFHALRRRVTQG